MSGSFALHSSAANACCIRHSCVFSRHPVSPFPLRCCQPCLDNTSTHPLCSAPATLHRLARLHHLLLAAQHASTTLSSSGVCCHAHQIRRPSPTSPPCSLQRTTVQPSLQRWMCGRQPPSPRLCMTPARHDWGGARGGRRVIGYSEWPFQAKHPPYHWIASPSALFYPHWCWHMHM